MFTVMAELSQLLRRKDFRLGRKVTVSVMVLLFPVRISPTLSALLTILWVSAVKIAN